MKLIHDSWKNTVVGCHMLILQHKLKMLQIELRSWNIYSFGNVQNEVIIKQTSLLVIQQSLETTSSPILDTLICQEKIAKEKLDHAFHCQYLFWKEMAKML